MYAVDGFSLVLMPACLPATETGGKTRLREQQDEV